MMDKPRHSLRRRIPVRVETLEGRSLLSAVKATTPPARVQLVVSPSNEYVNQQQASFSVNLFLKKQANPKSVATLDEPLTVDFTASMDLPGSVPGDATSPVFAPFHQSVTFPAGTSAETVTVPITSSAATTVPTQIYLSARPMAGSGPNLGYSGSVYLSSGPNASPPTITDVHLVSQGKVASAVELSFSKPMAQATVEDIHNYRILSRPKRTSQPGFLFWGGSATTEIQSFPIGAANYDPSTSTVTLKLKRPVRASSLYEVASAFPLNGHELTDTGGQPIASPTVYGYAVMNGFTTLIHPIPGFSPSPVGRLKITRGTDSPISNLNPLKGFS